MGRQASVRRGALGVPVPGRVAACVDSDDVRNGGRGEEKGKRNRRRRGRDRKRSRGPDWKHLVKCERLSPVTWRSSNARRRDGRVDGVSSVVMANASVTECRRMKVKSRRQVTWPM